MLQRMTLILLLATVTAVLFLAACGKKNDTALPAKPEEPAAPAATPAPEKDTAEKPLKVTQAEVLYCNS